jgi:hypothetical protein
VTSLEAIFPSISKRPGEEQKALRGVWESNICVFCFLGEERCAAFDCKSHAKAERTSAALFV